MLGGKDHFGVFISIFTLTLQYKCFPAQMQEYNHEGSVSRAQKARPPEDNAIPKTIDVFGKRIDIHLSKHTAVMSQ